MHIYTLDPHHNGIYYKYQFSVIKVTKQNLLQELFK